MAKTIGVRAFGTVMIFKVPDDADMDGFALAGIRSRKDAQQQLNKYLERQGYNPDESHLW